MRALVPLLLVMNVGAPAAAVTEPFRFRLPDASGIEHTEKELAGAGAAVFLFLAPGCPLSERYVPELPALLANLPAVKAFVVSATPLPGAAIPVLVDAKATLAARLGARVTPSAVVVHPPSGRVVYRGRIDDRAMAPTAFRQAASRQDLREALAEHLAAKPVSQPETRAAGCAITLPAPSVAAAAAQRFTYWQHAAPVLAKHCVECHRPGQTGPFPLNTFDEAAPRAAAIAQAVTTRQMPPWKAAPGPPHFAGERRLSAIEIAALTGWARAGAPEGNRPTSVSAAPPATANDDAPSPWQLGDPEHTIATPPFAIPAGGADLYHCFVIPARVAESRWVRAFEFRPGQPRNIHHALIFIDNTQAARRRDAETPEPGYPCFGVPGFLPSSSLGGWAPGTGAVAYPDGAAVALGKTSDIVVQIHAAPGSQPVTDTSRIGLYFAAQPPTRRMMDVALGSRDIDIAPGLRAYTVQDQFTLPVDVLATGIIPHAHFLCRRMQGWAVLPSGRRINLLTIPDWDFNWQVQYRYREPFVLPAGTVVSMEFVYDNSAANPRNPSSPPRRVVWGPGSADEMAGLHLQAIPLRNEDAEELGRALWGKLMRQIRPRR